MMKRFKFGTKCMFIVCMIFLFLNVDVECGRRSNPPAYGFKPSAPSAEHATNFRPLGINASISSIASPGNPSPYDFNLPSAPVGPPIKVKPVGNLPPGASYPIYPPPYTPYNPRIPPPAYNPVHNPAGYGAPPAYNSTYIAGGNRYSPVYGYGFYPQQPYHPGGNSTSISSGTSSGNPPAYGFNFPSTPTNVNLPPGAPYPIHPSPYNPHNPGIPQPAHNPALYGSPRTYNARGYRYPPAYKPGYGYGSYPQQPYYPGGYNYPNQHYSGSPGITNVNINNINTHHYGYEYPNYHYSSSDVGSDTLGAFLGYSLAKVTTPTYHYYSWFSDGYTPKYDHYEVHHYYHNRESIPAQSTIQPSTIVGCIGDSGTICPNGTTSLCTTNGAILCVASANSTVTCTNQKQADCVKTVIPCINGTEGCVSGQNKTLTIPCISQAQIPGNITYVNNTILVNYNMIVDNQDVNGTAGNVTTANLNSTTVSNSNSTQNSTVPLTNLTGLNNITDTIVLSTNVSSDGIRSKRETQQVPINEFCITILAIPAERKPTEQEQIFHKVTNIFLKFLVRAFVIRRKYMV